MTAKCIGSLLNPVVMCYVNLTSGAWCKDYILHLHETVCSTVKQRKLGGDHCSLQGWGRWYLDGR